MKRTIVHRIAPFAAAAALTCTAALAGPEGGQVIVGSGKIEFDGKSTWTITASNGAVFQFDSFNIAAFEAVLFDQPSSNSAVMNLIPFGGPSQIDGSLFANGIVFFVNPAGMVFGPGATVNVGGLYAAAANIGADQKDIEAFGQTWSSAWLAGDDMQFDLSGNITVEAGANLVGQSGIHLLGRHVANFGHIEVGNGGIISLIANDGTVTLAKPGDHYVVQFDKGVLPTEGDPGSIPGIGVHNAGTLNAEDNGTIIFGASDVYALAIKLEGSGISGTNVAFHGNVGLAIGPDDEKNGNDNGNGNNNGGGSGEDNGNGNDNNDNDNDNDNDKKKEEIFQGVTITAENVVFHGTVDALTFNTDTNLFEATGAGLEIIKLDGSGGNVMFEDAVGGFSPLSSLRVEGETNINGGLVSTSGSQVYEEAVTLGDDATLSGGSLTLMDGLDGGGHSLTITFGEQVEVSDDVFSNIEDFASTGAGGTLLGDFTTSGSQTYSGGGVTLAEETTTLTGTEITFNTTVDAQEKMEQALVINGDAVLGGDIGAVEALQSLFVSGQTQINGVIIKTINGQEYVGLVTLGQGTTTLEAQSLILGEGVDGDGNSLVLTIGELIEVSDEIFANMHNFTSDGEGGTLLRSFTTSGSQTYGNEVTLNGDKDGNVNLHASALEFGDTVDGAVDLSITAMEGDVAFHGQVGGKDKLTKLEVILESLMDDPQNGAVILFDTDLVRADEILLNDFTIGHTPFATIAGTGDLTFETDSFAMGQGQKMSVLGTLEIDAAGGEAVLGDINTLGNLIVNADSIVLLLRPPGDDTGLNFVVGGNIMFSTAPELAGVGAPPVFATPTGLPPANLQGFLFVIMPVSGGMFTDAEGRFLDLTPLGATVDDISTVFAQELPDPEEAEIVPGDADPALREALAELLPLRELEEWELVQLTMGRGIFDDAEHSEVEPEGAVPQPLAIAIRRANPDEAREVLTRRARLETQRDALIELFERGWAAYEDDVAHAAIPLRFVVYLQDMRLGDRLDHPAFTSEDAVAALRGLFAISDYVRGLEALGASPAEAQAYALGTVFEHFRPTQLTAEEFQEVIRGTRAMQMGEFYTRPAPPLR